MTSYWNPAVLGVTIDLKKRILSHNTRCYLLIFNDLIFVCLFICCVNMVTMTSLAKLLFLSLVQNSWMHWSYVFLFVLGKTYQRANSWKNKVLKPIFHITLQFELVGFKCVGSCAVTVLSSLCILRLGQGLLLGSQINSICEEAQSHGVSQVMWKGSVDASCLQESSQFSLWGLLHPCTLTHRQTETHTCFAAQPINYSL